jgi:hypothetical protein
MMLVFSLSLSLSLSPSLSHRCDHFCSSREANRRSRCSLDTTNRCRDMRIKIPAHDIYPFILTHLILSWHYFLFVQPFSSPLAYACRGATSPLIRSDAAAASAARANECQNGRRLLQKKDSRCCCCCWGFCSATGCIAHSTRQQHKREQQQWI